jgi:hypothetical protein
MIEWIPIKDFQIVDGEKILVFHNYKGEKRISLQDYYLDENKYKCGFGHVTHAARINFPVEKTLEDKFIDYYESMNGKEYTVGSMLKRLSEISKEHYEGKE